MTGESTTEASRACTVTVTVTVDYTRIFKDINNSPCIAVEEFAPLPEFVPHNLAGFHDGITRIPE
jgi:hypothetical protein